jgi:hypothetical protein
MTIQLKPEVDFNLNPEIYLTVSIVETAFNQYGLPLIINSGQEPCTTPDRRGCHVPNSAHYRGDAYDFRSKGIPRTVKDAIVQYIRQNIGAGFRLILENPGTTNEHFHFQYEPALSQFAYQVKGYLPVTDYPAYSGGQEQFDYDPDIPIEAPLPGGYDYPVYAGETWSNDLIWGIVIGGLFLVYVSTR